MFMKNLKETLNDDFNYSVTENGALGYRTSGKELLDLNFSVSSMRNMSEEKIVEKFVKAFYEDKILAMKWLFYCRDCREGIGERRLFRACMKYLAENHQDIAKEVIKLVPEYGRWDDLWCLLDTDLKDDVCEVVVHQLLEDGVNMKQSKPISLLAKWMPSANASSKETKRLAHIIMDNIIFTDRQYRKMLSELRAYLNVVEVKMSAKQWDKIDYAAVPSRANLIYNNAFLRNDEERRREYLNKLEKGETKINAGVLFPHDIVHKYGSSRWNLSPVDDPTLEQLWKALPDYVSGAGNTICVADGSGSMTSRIGGTNVTALSVANALAIYFAERSSGQFKDTYITFSSRPQIVDFSNANSLREKIEIAMNHCEMTNTNIEATFDLILQTAIRNEMTQDDMPQNVLVLSDLEFDRMTSGRTDKRLFEELADRYEAHGYKLPRLVFWNIMSRTGTIPVKENEAGVALVSGFSPAIVKMVLSNSTDPFECLLEQLNSERYTPVENAVKDLVA
jgi:hypothetical protein|nr:MAG TPA: protein of unknown function (DUF2828) [Bacteriophage sp.]